MVSSSEGKVELIVADYNTSHLDSLIEIVGELRESDPAFTGTRIGYSRQEVIDWLFQHNGSKHFVAIIDGEVVGHTSIHAAQPILADYLVDIGFAAHADVWEIAKIFVKPTARGLGVASRLRGLAKNYILGSRRIPSAVVMAVSTVSLEWHQRLTDLPAVGSFDGKHGTNYVFLHQNG